MRIVGCLYLCLDMFLKGRLFPDTAQFNKENFRHGVDEHLHIFASFGPSLCCTFSLFPSPPVKFHPRPCTHTLLSNAHGYCDSFSVFLMEVSKHSHVVGIYFRSMYTQCKLKSPTQMRLKSLKCDLSSYLSQRIFSLFNSAMF